eukprot:1181886-Pyramimonas_sp.AAC.1
MRTLGHWRCSTCNARGGVVAASTRREPAAERGARMPATAAVRLKLRRSEEHAHAACRQA